MRAAGRPSVALSVAVTAVLALLVSSASSGGAQSRPPVVPDHLSQRAMAHGHVRVIVELGGAGAVPEVELQSQAAVATQRQNIRATRAFLKSHLRGTAHAVIREYESLPVLAIRASPDALRLIESLRGIVTSVHEDLELRPLLLESGPLVQADQAVAAGFDGSGTAIAVLDTGVDKTHPFLGGRVVAEACFSSGRNGAGTGGGDCPNGQETQIGAGAGVPCTGNCAHGTHVAGIVAGNGQGAGQAFSGVAKQASVIAIQVFTADGGTAFFSDILAALVHVDSLRNTFNIASVNMSLGGSAFASTCDAVFPSMATAIQNLRQHGIATVIASGNESLTNQVAFPACISSAISVGSTRDGSAGFSGASPVDTVSSFSNAAPFLSLLAPGQVTISSVPSGGFANFQGTSMATPHVAGAFALVRQAAPAASVDQLLQALQNTGLPVTDTRQNPPLVTSRIRVRDAIAALTGPTQITSLNPSSVVANGPNFTLTVNGTNFQPASVVQINGSARTTTFVNGTQVTATILASDIATSASSASISVFTPPPGGGVSNVVSLLITPPTLNAAPTAGSPGSPYTVTLANWGGGALDWLTIVPVGAPNTVFGKFVYVSSLPGTVTTRTWTDTLPTTLGQFELRLFLNNGFTRAATSNVVTVANINPTPAITGLTPAAVAAGSAGFVLTVNGAGFVNGATVQVNGVPRTTTFGSGTQVTAAILSGDVTSIGTANITVVNPAACAGGLCSSNAAALAVTPPPPPPVLNAINPPNVAVGGGNFTLTLTGQNFVGASVVRVNGSPRQTTYGSVTTSLTATLLAADIAQAANLSITVITPAPGGGTSGAQVLAVVGPALNAVPATGPPGSPYTVTLTNWGGGALDWLTIAPVGAANTTYGKFVYVSSLPGTATTRTWTDALPTTLGQFELRLFLNNGFTRAATSNVVTVANINPTPAITGLTPAAVAAGSGAFALTVNGTGFVNGATATVGGVARAVTFVSGTQLTLGVLAGDVAAVGTVNVVVTNPAACVGGLCSSSTAQLQVTPPPPAPGLTAVNPTNVTAGGGSFTLTATGTNFVPASVVRVNGVARATIFDSAGQLRATILAGDIAQGGNLSITVVTPAPGGGTSGAQVLAVVGPALNAVPATGPPGSPYTVTLTNWGGGALDWLTIVPVGAANSSFGKFVYVSTLPGTVTTRTWTDTLPTTLGQFELRLFLNNGFTRAATSNVVTVANINPTPAITALVPVSVAAGSAGFNLTVNGNGFVNGATVQVNGVPRTTTFGSGTQVTAAILVGDVSSVATLSITVVNPGPCVPTGCVSNTAQLGVTPPPPAPGLTAVNPTSVTAGGGSFTLTATGTNFAANSVVRVNGAPRATTFVNSTTLTATLLAGDIAQGGNLSITVVTPAPGGGTSGAQTLAVVGPALSAVPGIGPPGSPYTVTLTNWGGGALDWLTIAPVGAANTTYGKFVYVSSLPGTATTRTWVDTFPATLGPYEFRLFLNNGYTRAATSNGVTVANINPTPALTGLSPAAVAAGSAAFALTVNGTGFVNGATATVGGVARAVTFVSGTQVTIAVQAGDVAGVGNVNVVVTNPGPCVPTGCVSNSAQLGVTPPPAAPGLTAINPTSVTAGGGSFTLTATGTNFVPLSVVQVNGAPRATTFVNSTTLTATLLAGDIAQGGNLSITVVTPAPGGGTSGAQTLQVVGPAINLTPGPAPPGNGFSATLTNWGGGSLDWLAIAPIGAANTTYSKFIYVSTLPGTATTRTWTDTLPTPPGTYEVRLFLNNGFTRAATSNALAAAQVRVFNGLVLCLDASDPTCSNPTFFTGRLTASQGPTWSAFSGTASPYQPVTATTLSSFVAEAIGFPGTTVNIPASFGITLGRRYTISSDVDDGTGNVVLTLADEGVVPNAVTVGIVQSVGSVTIVVTPPSGVRFQRAPRR